MNSIYHRKPEPSNLLKAPQVKKRAGEHLTRANQSSIQSAVVRSSFITYPRALGGGQFIFRTRAIITARDETEVHKNHPAHHPRVIYALPEPVTSGV